jgi:hypothetical protein
LAVKLALGVVLILVALRHRRWMNGPVSGPAWMGRGRIPGLPLAPCPGRLRLAATVLPCLPGGRFLRYPTAAKSAMVPLLRAAPVKVRLMLTSRAGRTPLLTSDIDNSVYGI